MYNSKHFAGQIGRRNTIAVLLLLITLFLGGVSVARAQTAGTNAGSSATSSTASTADGQQPAAMGSAEAAGNVFGRILVLLMCPAAVVFVLYKAFAKKGGANGGPTNTLNKP